MIWCVILSCLSGWMTIAYGGGFAGVKFPSKRSYSNWSHICNSAPYSYLSPFQFTFSGASYNGSASISSTDPTICPFPAENSDLRLVLTTFGFATVGLLFIKTPISLFARIIFAVYALLFFSSFVIDANASNTGSVYCKSNFMNSNLNADIQSMGMTITCNNSNFSGVAVIDLILSGLFFMLHTAWGLTKDLYVVRGGKSDEKELLKSMGDDKA